MTEMSSASSDSPSLWDLLQAAGRWLAEHREEIEAFGMWGSVMAACERTALYVPEDAAWRRIAEAAHDGADEAALETLILGLYAPGGSAHESLCEELRSAPLLLTRAREVNEVLASLADERHYVTVCGALPLVEGVLAAAHGKGKSRLSDYPLFDRLDAVGTLTPDEEAELLLNGSSLQMLERSIPEVWRNGRMQPGAVTAEFNRHFILHGTARGWDTRENAVRAVLLVAAAARVAGPLLGPR